MIVAGQTAREALSDAADRVLLHDFSGRSRSGDQLALAVERIVGALIGHAGQGCKVGLWYENSIAAVEAFLAVEWAGGTRVPVDPNATLDEARGVFDAANVDIVLVDKAHRAGLTGAVLVHDDLKPLVGPPTFPGLEVDPGKTLVLYPRAVSDGRLFAVPLSYANWRATMQTNVSLYRSGRYGPWVGEQECFLAVQQIMHGTGFVGTFPFLEMGLAQVIANQFDAERVLEAVDLHGVTTTVLVPAMLYQLIDAASRQPNAGASLRHVIYGGGAVRQDRLRQAIQRFGPVLSQGYGRIEGGWPLSILDPEDHAAILAGDDRLATSCGRPIDGVSVKIRFSSASASDCGELCVAGEMVVAEYADPDGWCSLGDVVRIDSRGYLFHQGRLDRMINTGYHIYPAEIEEVIGQVVGVRRVRVLGEIDGKGRETVVAHLVLTHVGTSGGVEKRVRQHLAKKLANYKMPRRFYVADELPELT